MDEVDRLPDMWVDPDDDPRETGDPRGTDGESLDDRGILLDYLRSYRLTREMKCAGLDAEQMARRRAVITRRRTTPQRPPERRTERLETATPAHGVAALTPAH